MFKLKDFILPILCISFIMSLFPVFAKCEENKVIVSGNQYKFGKSEKYNFENSESSGSNTHVNLSINGTDVEQDINDMTVYTVAGDEAVSFSYSLDKTFYTENENEWHIVDDKTKKVNGITLNSNILKGALILQISNDKQKWVTVDEKTNVFSNNEETNFYDVTDLELLNGCYYRITFAYELCKREEDDKILFVNKSNYSYEKYAEVFEFYLYNREKYVGTKLDKLKDSEKVTLGEKIRTEDEGYSGELDLDKDDPHYGWTLGKFFISGFTSKPIIDNQQYILKNVGDKVTLGFYLEEDIDNLNGKSNLSISRDKEGYDKEFEISPMDFGRGTLIVQYTNPDGETTEPQIYTNYLEANLSPKANTAIMLCEEGDYKIALDYEIKNDDKVVFGNSLFPKKTHYRISFNFSVRNSNCMVYTFDCLTNSSLSNGSITKNGFKIDLANSKYLDVSVKKEILENGANGLVEDTKFNRKAKNGDAYTEEGIYTITVKNKAADLQTEKKIYVGDNDILKAYMTTGLTISEILSKKAQGASILDDGTIVEKSGKEIEKIDNLEETTEPESTNMPDATNEELILPEETVNDNQKIKNISIDYGIVIVSIALVAIISAILYKKKNK